jgi:hypothetical protein
MELVGPKKLPDSPILLLKYPYFELASGYILTLKSIHYFLYRHA